MNCYKCATPVPDNARFCSACGTDVSGDSHGQGETLAAESDPQLFAKLQSELGTEFVLEKELGRGGMAVVYLGKDPHLNRKVAVKVLPPELTYGGGSSMIERFKREAQTAAKLDHPNIIPVFRVSTGGKLFWYVMKYLDGKALNDTLEQEGQLSVEMTVEIISQTAAALDYAHRHQVVHRDIKPANIIVDQEGRVTVTDFGIAKALDANTLTASGSIIGTPYYMSPEQCKGKKVGPAADQYSLAVMTYQMLGGHVPFTGDSAVEIVHKHVADPVPPLGVLRPELPEKVVAVVEKGLAKEAEDRFSTTAEFAKALKAAAQGIDVQLAPPRKPAPGRMSKTALVSPVPGVMRSAKGEVKSRKGLWIGGGVVGIAAVAGVVVTVVLPRIGQQPAPPPAPVQDTVAQVATQPPLGDTTRPAPDTAAAAPAVTPGAVVTPPAAGPRPARLRLRGVPDGAVVTRDGQRVRGAVVEVVGGRAHVLSVTKPGFEPWTQTVTPSAGEEMFVSVSLRAAAGQAAAQAPTTPASGQPAQAPRTTPSGAAAPTQPPAAQPPAASGTARITIGSMPATATMFINGQPMPRNPMRDYEVPAGSVTVRFVVTDSTGVSWERSFTYTLQGGETRSVGRVTLTRP